MWGESMETFQPSKDNEDIDEKTILQENEGISDKWFKKK